MKSSAFNAAPPIRPPSISGMPNNSAALPGFTLPPYNTRMAFAIAGASPASRVLMK